MSKTKELSQSSQEAVARFLTASTEAQRLEIIEEFKKAPDKDLIAHQLHGLLESGNHWERTWYVTVIAAISQTPEMIGAIAEYLDPNREVSEFVRYWAAIGLTKMMQGMGDKAQLQKKLIAYSEEEANPLVRAVILRLLIENQIGDKEALDELIQMLDSPEWDIRQAACKALRPQASSINGTQPPFSYQIENKLVPKLKILLHDPREAADVRYYTAHALRSMHHQRQDVLYILAEVLKTDMNMSDWPRRACVEALAELNIPDIKEAMLYGIRDRDAQIRERSTKALNDTLGSTTAVKYIVENILKEKEPSPHYITALRETNSNVAAQVLKDALLHPDPDVAQRATWALTELGGEAALRTLQAQQALVVNKYTELLGKADERIMEQFEGIMSRARIAFQMTMWMHGIIFGVGVITLVFSLGVTLWDGFETFVSYIGAVGATGSVGVLLALFYRDPLSNISTSVNNLVKVNVVFLGYIRQINQIDATFKQLFLSSNGFTIKQMQDTVLQIETSVDKTLQKVQEYLKD